MKRLLKACGLSCVLLSSLLATSFPYDNKVDMSNKKMIGLERLYYGSLSKQDASKKIKYTPILKEALGLMIDPSKYVALDRSGNTEPLPNGKKARSIPNFSLVIDKLLLSVKKEKNEASAFYALYLMSALSFGSKQQREEIAPVLAKTLAKKNNCYAHTIIYAKSGIKDKKVFDKLIQDCPQYGMRYRMLSKFDEKKSNSKGKK